MFLNQNIHVLVLYLHVCSVIKNDAIFESLYENVRPPIALGIHMIPVNIHAPTKILKFSFCIGILLISRWIGISLLLLLLTLFAVQQNCSHFETLRS